MDLFEHSALPASVKGGPAQERKGVAQAQTSLPQKEIAYMGTNAAWLHLQGSILLGGLGLHLMWRACARGCHGK